MLTIERKQKGRWKILLRLSFFYPIFDKKWAIFSVHLDSLLIGDKISENKINFVISVNILKYFQVFRMLLTPRFFCNILKFVKKYYVWSTLSWQGLNGILRWSIKTKSYITDLYSTFRSFFILDISSHFARL